MSHQVVMKSLAVTAGHGKNTSRKHGQQKPRRKKPTISAMLSAVTKSALLPPR